MTDTALDTILEAIYASLKNENKDLDKLILELKIYLYAQKMKSVEVDTTKLVQPNRQGRKMMQTYFKKRGVTVTFANVEAVDETAEAAKEA